MPQYTGSMPQNTGGGSMPQNTGSMPQNTGGGSMPSTTTGGGSGQQGQVATGGQQQQGQGGQQVQVATGGQQQQGQGGQQQQSQGAPSSVATKTPPLTTVGTTTESNDTELPVCPLEELVKGLERIVQRRTAATAAPNPDMAQAYLSALPVWQNCTRVVRLFALMNRSVYVRPSCGRNMNCDVAELMKQASNSPQAFETSAEYMSCVKVVQEIHSAPCVDVPTYGIGNSTYGIGNTTYGIGNSTYGVGNGTYGIGNGTSSGPTDCNLMQQYKCPGSCCSGGACPTECVPLSQLCCRSGNGTGSSSTPPACGGCTNMPCSNMCGAMPCQFCDGLGHCDSQPQPCDGSTTTGGGSMPQNTGGQGQGSMPQYTGSMPQNTGGGSMPQNTGSMPQNTGSMPQSPGPKP
jgi:hypothetical protein